jgi:transcriptional regulator with XRE-family HTH domain
MAKALFYSLKPEGVVINMVDAATGMPKFETLQVSHPYFKRVIRALKRKEWTRVPKLLSIAQMIADKSYGNVEVRKDGLYYKGRSIDNSLTTRILQMIKENRSVGHMLKFMDNLYQNPEEFAIHELYDWLNGCKLPITDRGTFMAYKRVTREYKDCRTQSIDNSVGQIVFMKREDVCKDRTQTCEQGLHFCSIAYLPEYPGERIMMVEINPKDVVSIPDDYNFTKGRTWMYEVVQEVPEDQVSTLLDRGVDIEEYRTAVYSVAKDRKKLLADILALPTIKSMIRYQKKVQGRKRVKRGRKAKTEQFILSEKSIRKMTIGRLRKLFIQFAPPEPPKMSVSVENRLEAIRKTYGFTRGQVAEAMGVSYSAVFHYERAKELAQEVIDSYLGAVMKLAQLGQTHQTGISFPKPTVQFKYTAPAPSVPEESEEDEGDEFGYEEEEEYNDGWGEEEDEEVFN